MWSGQPPGGGGGGQEEEGGEAGHHHGPPPGDWEDEGLHPAGRDVLRVLAGLAGAGDVGGGGEAGDGRQTAGHRLGAGGPPVRRPGGPALRLRS